MMPKDDGHGGNVSNIDIHPHGTEKAKAVAWCADLTASRLTPRHVQTELLITGHMCAFVEREEQQVADQCTLYIAARPQQQSSFHDGGGGTALDFKRGDVLSVWDEGGPCGAPPGRFVNAGGTGGTGNADVVDGGSDGSCDDGGTRLQSASDWMMQGWSETSAGLIYPANVVKLPNQRNANNRKTWEANGTTGAATVSTLTVSNNVVSDGEIIRILSAHVHVLKACGVAAFSNEEAATIALMLKARTSTSTSTSTATHITTETVVAATATATTTAVGERSTSAPPAAAAVYDVDDSFLDDDEFGVGAFDFDDDDDDDDDSDDVSAGARAGAGAGAGAGVGAGVGVEPGIAVNNIEIGNGMLSFKKRGATTDEDLLDAEIEKANMCAMTLHSNRSGPRFRIAAWCDWAEEE